MGMEGQGQPVAAAHGRSLSCDYRVCCSPRGFDHRDTLARVKCIHVCMCVCVWAQDSDHRVCLCECVCMLGRENCWDCSAKKTTTGGRCRPKKYKTRDTEGEGARDCWNKE